MMSFEFWRVLIRIHISVIYTDIVNFGPFLQHVLAKKNIQRVPIKRFLGSNTCSQFYATFLLKGWFGMVQLCIHQLDGRNEKWATRSRARIGVVKICVHWGRKHIILLLLCENSSKDEHFLRILQTTYKSLPASGEFCWGNPSFSGSPRCIKPHCSKITEIKLKVAHSIKALPRKEWVRVKKGRGKILLGNLLRFQ